MDTSLVAGFQLPRSVRRHQRLHALIPWLIGPPRPWQIVIHIRYRDNSERVERTLINVEFLATLMDELVNAEDVREVRIHHGPEIFYHHKSYAEDFDTSQLMKMFAVSPSTPPEHP